MESQIPKAAAIVPPATLKLQSFFHGVSKLRARIKNYLRLGDDATVDRQTTVDSYLRAAVRLEDRVEDWCDVANWLPQKVSIATTQLYGRPTPWTSASIFRLHCFETWAAFFHWNRYFVAKICLHTALLDALKTLPVSSIDETISLHLAVVHETVRDFLGTFSYAFGDVDEHGRAHPVPTAAVGDGPRNEHRGVNVPATLQIQPPLSHLITLKYLAPGQREAMYLALQRIRAEFTLM